MRRQRLWHESRRAFAAVNLGISTEQFLDCSPVYFDCLSKQYGAREKRAGQLLELMGAQVVAMIANTGFKGWEEPRKIQEFMPSEWAKAPKRKSRAQKIAEMETDRAVWKAMAMHAGKFVRAQAKATLEATI